MENTGEIILKLLLSIAIGGIIGAEREYQNKSAGFRTMMLISLGATIFTMISVVIGNTSTPGRIASNVVTGIGFVGAGVIFKGDSGVNGITTAATIWVTAALGMSVGAGYEMIAIIGCIILLPILLAFTRIEKWFDRINKTRNYRIISSYQPGITEHYEKILHDHKLKYRRINIIRNDEKFYASWHVWGKDDRHSSFIDRMLDDPSVLKFEY